MKFKHLFFAAALVITLFSCKNKGRSGGEIDYVKLKEDQQVSERAQEGTPFHFRSNGQATRKLFGSDLVKTLENHMFYNGKDGEGSTSFPFVSYYENNKLMIKFNTDGPFFHGDIQKASNGEYIYANTSADYSYNKPEVKLYPIQSLGQPFQLRLEVEDRGKHVITQTLQIHCNIGCTLGCERDGTVDLTSPTKENRD